MTLISAQFSTTKSVSIFSEIGFCPNLDLITASLCNFRVSEFHNMEGAMGCFVVAILLLMQNGLAVVGHELDSERHHHVDAVPNSAFQGEDPKASMHEAHGGETTAGAELNARGGHSCFLSGLLGHCTSGKKAKLPVSSVGAWRNAKLLQISLGVGGTAGGHGTSGPRGYKNHPPATASKHNVGSRTVPSSSLNFCMLVLAVLFYSLYHYNHY